MIKIIKKLKIGRTLMGMTFYLMTLPHAHGAINGVVSSPINLGSSAP